MIAAEIESWHSGTQRRDLAFVVTSRVAEPVGRQRRVMQGGLGEVVMAASCALPLFSERPLLGLARSAIALTMKRAVIGVPS